MAKLYFRYGAMNAAKSAQLLTAAHNYEELGKRVVLFNYEGDTRMGTGVISSRVGLQKPCLTFNSSTIFYNHPSYDGASAIFVDEAQFLTESQVILLHVTAIQKNIPVLCYGLRTDFQGNLFPGSAALMAHAETIEELKTICKCGKKATHVARYIDGVRQLDGEQIVIGDTNYKSMCYDCWVRT